MHVFYLCSFVPFLSPAQSTHQEEEWILEAEKCITLLLWRNQMLLSAFLISL
jgi:hypothetical protein